MVIATKFDRWRGSRRGRRTLAAALALALVASAGVAAAEEQETVVKVFRIQYADVSEVSAAIQPLLSEDGTVTVQPATGRVTVRDRADVMERVAEAVKRVDRKPTAFLLHVELLEGSASPFSTAATVQVDRRLKKMLPFKNFRSLGAADLGGVTGDDISVDLKEGYRIATKVYDHRIEETPFGLPTLGLRLDLRPFVLTRANGDTDQELLRTRVVLSVNQDVVIGAGHDEGSDHGLVVIIRAKPAG